MDRKELIELRNVLFDEFKTRERLGEFDANSKAILLCLESIAKLTTYLINQDGRPIGRSKNEK